MWPDIIGIQYDKHAVCQSANHTIAGLNAFEISLQPCFLKLLFTWVPLKLPFIAETYLMSTRYGLKCEKFNKFWKCCTPDEVKKKISLLK